MDGQVRLTSAAVPLRRYATVGRWRPYRSVRDGTLDYNVRVCASNAIRGIRKKGRGGGEGGSMAANPRQFVDFSTDFSVNVMRRFLGRKWCICRGGNVGDSTPGQIEWVLSLTHASASFRPLVSYLQNMTAVHRWMR